MESGFGFFLVALVVEREEAVEDGEAGWLVDGETLALHGNAEAVAQTGTGTYCQIAQVIDGDHGFIHFQNLCRREHKREFVGDAEAVFS